MSEFPLFVAEVSSNHSCNINRAKEFIRVSSEICCYAVKFQLFKIDELFSQEVLKNSDEHRKRENWELPVEFIPELAKYAHELGLKFSCTPFYLKAVEELEPYVDFYKIASYELLWDDLIIACAKTGKDLVLSTGMATIKEIEHAVDIFRKHSNSNLILLHAISGYPTPVKEANLKAIQTLRDKFNCKVGLSDHSVSPSVITRATFKWDVSMIEFHLDLDEKGEEYKGGHCWLPYEMKNTINFIKDGLLADGTGVKTAAPSELSDRDWRADPSDGLRPLKKIRDTINEKYFNKV